MEVKKFHQRANKEIFENKAFTVLETEYEPDLVTAKVSISNREALVFKAIAHDAFISLIIDNGDHDVSIQMETADGNGMGLAVDNELFPMSDDDAKEEAYRLLRRALKIAKATKERMNETRLN